MSDVFGIAAFIFFQLAFAYVFFYLVCYRYIFRPLLHSMGWKGKAPEPTHALQGTEKYSFQIVGESFYQPAIAAIAGPKTPDGVDVVTTAIVALDDFNRYDNKSVRVEMEGKIVGNFSRENARKYRDWLKSHGIKKATCIANARITGGWLRGSGEGSYGVTLDFVMSKPPIPMNDI